MGKPQPKAELPACRLCGMPLYTVAGTLGHTKAVCDAYKSKAAKDAAIKAKKATKEAAIKATKK